MSNQDILKYKTAIALNGEGTYKLMDLYKLLNPQDATLKYSDATIQGWINKKDNEDNKIYVLGHNVYIMYTDTDTDSEMIDVPLNEMYVTRTVMISICIHINTPVSIQCAVRLINSK